MEEKKGIKSFMAKVAEKAGKEFDESKADEFIKKYNNDYGKIVDDIGTNMGVKPERLSEFRERAFKEYAITAPTTPGVSPEEIPKTTDKARSFTNDYLDFNKAGHEYDIANKEIPKSQFDIQSPGKELRNQGPAYDEEAIIEAMPTLSKIEHTDSTWEGFGKELGLGLTFGGNAFNQLLADTPDFVNRFLVSQYNLSPLGQAQQNIGELIGRDWKMKAKDLRSEKFADYTKEQQSIIRKKVGAVNPKMEEDILAAIKKGDWITFTRNVARQVAESTASSIGIMTAGAATGGASMVGMGTAVFGAGKYREVDEAAPNMSEDKKVLIAGANGALEGIFETTFGSAAVGKAFVKLIANEGKDVAKGIALKGLRKGFSDVILKYPAMAPLGEGFEEWGTQITQNYVDKLSGFRPDLDVMEGSTQAFIIGAAAGASHGAIIRGARIGQDAVLSPIKRNKVKKQYENAVEVLADIPNDQYTTDIQNATKNISDPQELSAAFEQINDIHKENISEEDIMKATYFVVSHVQHSRMNESRDDQIEANITKFQDKNGNVSKATIDGKVWYIQNPQDIGTGRVIFAKNEAGETKGFANQKVTEAVTKTPDEIRNDVIMQDEFLEQEAEKQAAIQKEAADKGIVVNQTAVGPHGKGTVISINENGNGTVTIADTKGDTMEVQMNEVEPFKTTEQKAAEKEQEKAEKEAQDALMEGIEEGAEIESDEEQSGVRVVNFNNEQSKVITAKGEQVFNTTEERDAAIKAIVDERLKDEVSIDDLNPEDRYSKLLKDDTEIAQEMLSEDIADIRSNAKELRSAKVESKSEKLKNKKEAKVLDQEADRLEGILNGETQKIVDQAESLFVEMEQEKENAPSNQLTEWQQEALGESFSSGQFVNFKDKNEITATLARAWLNKTGTPIDTWVAAWNQGIEEGQYGGDQVTVEDVVDFIVANPSKNIRSTTGRMNEIREEYKTATGKSIDNHETFIKESGLTPQSTTKTNDPQAIAYEEGIAKLKEAGYTDEQIEKINQTDEPGGVTKETLIQAPVEDVPFRATETKEIADEKPIEQVSQVEGDVLQAEDAKKKVKRKRISKGLETDVETPHLNISEKASEDLKYKMNALRALGIISNELKQPTQIISSSEMPEEVRAEERRRIAKGKEAVGFYYNGTTYIISDRIRSVSEVKKTYIHESIVHKGLKGIFEQGDQKIIGKQYAKFNELMTDIYGSMTQMDKLNVAKTYFPNTYKEYYDKNGKEISTPSPEVQAFIAEEYMAELSEQEIIPTKWQDFYNKLTQIIRKTFGLTSKQFTQTDLVNIIREQRRKLAETANIESKTLDKVPETAKDKADIQLTKDLVEDERLQKKKPDVEGGEQKVRFRTAEQSKIISDAKKYSDVNDFIQAYEEVNFRDMHRAPGDSGFGYTIEERMDEGDDFSLLEVSQGYSVQPNDYFHPVNGARWYGYDNMEGMESYNAIQKAMASINEQLMDSEEVQDIPMIMAYRSVPNSVDTDVLNDGDWITFSEQYAISHGEHRFGENEYKLIAEEVPADKVWWDGNDINEWGYDTGETEFLGRADLKRIWEEANTKTKFRAQAETQIELKIEQLQKQRERIITEKNRLTKQANQRNGLFGDTQADPTDLFGGGAFNPQAILQKEKEFDAEIQRIDKEVALLKKQNVTGKMESSGQMTMFKIAFEPTQIKSATANIGTFDTENADIRFRVAESKQEIEDFVKDSKVKETVYHGTPNALFDSFREGSLFTKNKEYARRYTGQGASSISYKKEAKRKAVYSAKLNIQNPFDTRNDEARDIFETEYQAYYSPNLTERGLIDWLEADNLAEWLQENYPEYDGLVLDEGGEPTFEDSPYTEQYESVKDNFAWRGESYYIFNPEQALIENIEESPDTRFKVDQAASETNTNPSEEQKHAGNYKMGHVAFDGFDISIENPKGSTRSGKDQDGKEWSREMPANYGYFKGTIGKDKDHIDVFIGDNPESDKIYVIDQVNPKTGSFDEHKIMLGFDNVSKARNTYNSAYEDGWTGLGQITRTDKDGLKEWFKGDTKKPYASDVRFKITEESTNPEIAALFERLSALEKVSKKTERAKELTKAVTSAKTPEFLKDDIKEKLNTYREGVKAGTKHTKEQIDEIESAIINYIGKNLDLGEAGARDIKSAFTAIRNAKRSKRAVEKAFDKIDELTGKVEIKKQKGKNTSHIKRLMDWMKNTDSFVYANNVEFKTFREIDKATIEQQKVLNSPNSTEAQKEAADNELDRMWNELDAKVENRTMLEDVQMKLIEYRRNKTDASPELIAAIREDLQIIYDAAKDSKKGEDIQKAIDRKSDREFVKGLIEPEAKEDAGWLKRVRMTLNDWTISSAGNWETLLNQLGGQKLRDKFSLILNQANQEVSRQATFDKVLDDAKEAYGFKTKEEMLSHLQELKKKDFTLVKPNREGERGEGKDHKLSRMDIMDLYNAIKNENIMNDAYMTYGDISLAEDGSRDTEAQKASGKDRIDGLIENLSDGDKAFADIMQVETEAYYSKYNRVFIDSYNRDLKKSDNYWPSSAEFANENDAFEQFRQDAMRPSATQERTAHRSVKIADAFDKFVNHVKAGEWYDNMAIPVNRMNNILKNPNVKDLIIEARGEEFYKTMITHLQEQGLNPPSKAVAPTEVESFFGNILNNWVSAAIGLSPSVPVKQLLSVINYSENMPVGKWAAGFAKGLAGPKAIKDTWEEMMKIPYLKTRIGTGYSEALQYVMNADSAAPKAATGWQKMKNIMTGGTRYGDIAAIVFGGKPYLDYLVNEKGMEYQDAVDQFLLDTLRSQQSPFSSSLSTWQNSKEVIKRSIFAFSNTPSQYMRKMFEANEAYRKGDISKGQLAKVYSIYGVLSSANYVIVGALMSALLSGKDWDEDLLEKVLVQFGISTVGGIPIVKDFAEGLGRTLVGLDVYDDVSPLLEGANKVLEISKRLANADEDTDKTKLYLEGIKYLAPFAGISFRNIEKVWNATVNRSKTFDAARVKKTDKTLTELKKSEDIRKAESAKDMKSAYSSAKRKATALKKEGKNSQSDKIIELIETSKANLAKTDYDYIDIGSESRKFNRLFKVYSK